MSIEIEEKKMEAVVEKVRKLLNLASKNPNEAEAASAAAKANELLLAYNLDMSTVEQSEGGSGKREEAKVKGGMYKYERELWEDIARLNFCFYFTTRELEKRNDRRFWRFKHRLIGRVVNTSSTKVMGLYLQGTIERISRDRFPSHTQIFSSEAVAFREGMATAVRDKLRKKRREIENKEAARATKEEEDRIRAARSGVSLATTLTIADVRKSEEEANYDFIHGEGAFAKRKAREEKWDKEAAARRARQAAADQAAAEAYTRWAEAHPEEAAKEEAKVRAAERAKEKAAQRRRDNGGGWGRSRSPTARERRESSNYFHEGHDKGRAISLDPQMDAGSAKRIGR